MRDFQVKDDSRCLHKPAWGPTTLVPVQQIEQIGGRLPLYAFIRTNRAIYGRAKIIHESREAIQVVFVKKSSPDKDKVEKKCDEIRKRDILTLRIYTD